MPISTLNNSHVPVQAEAPGVRKVSDAADGTWLLCFASAILANLAEDCDWLVGGALVGVSLKLEQLLRLRPRG